MIKPIIGIGSDVAQKKGERERAFAYATYIESLRRAGAVPVLIPPQPENAEVLVENLDGVVLAGGDDCDPSVYGEERHPSVEPMDPRRQNNDLMLARVARERGIPTFGICLGVQMMNVAAGGTLIQDIDSELRTEILGQQELNVNSSHHQAIRHVGNGLRVTALAPDGIIEGLEDPSHPFYVGVQWHPEDMPGEPSASSLFGAFVDAARRYAEKRRRASTELSPVGAARPE